MTSMTARSARLFAFMVALILLPYDVIADGGCYELVDILHIQDVTSSFHPFWPDLLANISDALTLATDNLPDTYFGVASFSDKPISWFNTETKELLTIGGDNGYCLRVDQPLQRPDVPEIVKLFQGLQSQPGGEGDYPASVFEALYRAIITTKLQWRQEPLVGKKVGRFVILVTASPSHLPGDLYNLTGRGLRPFDINPLRTRTSRNNENYRCDKFDYPTVDQLAELMASLKDTTIVLLVAPGGTTDSEGRFQPYESTAALGSQYQSRYGLMLWYRDQLHDAGLFQVHVRQLDPEGFAYGYPIRDIVHGQYTNVCRKPVDEVQQSSRYLTDTDL